MGANTPMSVAKIGINGIFYQVELATTTEYRRLGLMHRFTLADDRGMLLVYPKSGDHRIWMKNMHISLNVYWIDEDHRIVHHRRVEPCTANPCPVFAAPVPSRYVLELNDSHHAIGVGDRVTGLDNLP